MTKNSILKGSFFTTILLASLLTIFPAGAASTSSAQTVAEQTEKEWLRYFDMRKDKGGKPIPLAEIEAVAGRASDEVDGLVIVSYTDDYTTKTYYEYAQRAKDEGKPMVAFLRAPEDEYNSFIIYADGRAIALDDSDGDKKHYNSPSELVMTIDFSIKMIEDGTTKRSVPEKDTSDGASLTPSKEIRRFKLLGSEDTQQTKEQSQTNSSSTLDKEKIARDNQAAFGGGELKSPAEIGENVQSCRAEVEERLVHCFTKYQCLDCDYKWVCKNRGWSSSCNSPSEMSYTKGEFFCDPESGKHFDLKEEVYADSCQ